MGGGEGGGERDGVCVTPLPFPSRLDSHRMVAQSPSAKIVLIISGCVFLCVFFLGGWFSLFPHRCVEVRCVCGGLLCCCISATHIVLFGVSF